MSHHKKNHGHPDPPKPGNEKNNSSFPDQTPLSPWTQEPKPGGDGTSNAGPPGAGSAPAAPPGPPATELIDAAVLAELKKKAAERDEYLDLLQRTRAEYLNYIKRAQKDRADTIKYGVQEFAAKVVAVMDDFARAIASAEKTKEFERFFEGIRLIETQFQKVLSEAGITPIETVGKPFDPGLHEALMQEERADVPEGTILEELQRGFMLNDRVLRAAKVKVSRKPAEKAAESAEPKPQGPKEEKKE